VPGSEKYVAVAAPHHGYNYGSLVLVDQRAEDDGAMSQLKRITPEVAFPESESAPGASHKKGRHNPKYEVYGTPWPLSEDFYLCVYDPGQKHYGIYLVDSFGNRELLYRDPEVACLDPIPLRPRRRPPVIPSATTQARADQKPDRPSKATIAIMDMYQSDFKWPQDTKVTALRVIQLYPKSTYHLTTPQVGVGHESLVRGVAGVVPVEADGSAYFEAPVGVPIYFQALDERGRAVQSMRSATYVHPGESMTCIGCHEPKTEVSTVPRSTTPLALQRPPSPLKPEVPEALPISYPLLVQPVLDRHCVACHQERAGEGASDLSGKTIGKHGWTSSYHALAPFAWGLSGGNGIITKNGMRSVPGQVGAEASKLMQLLDAGHYDVKLPPEDLRRITVWLDANSNFFGAYHDTERQARGERVWPEVE
jgi:hypothetical protein